MDLHLDSVSVCLEDEGRDSAILGFQVHLHGIDGVEESLSPIGQMECDGRLE